VRGRKPAQANGNGAVKSNGHSNGNSNGNAKKAEVVKDHKIDDSGEFEFGGVYGTAMVMTGFPLLMWYLWVGQTFYDGQFPLPEKGQAIGDFVMDLVNKAIEVSSMSSGRCARD
jgi:delta24(24(1))-sterol reductase